MRATIAYRDSKKALQKVLRRAFIWVKRGGQNEKGGKRSALPRTRLRDQSPQLIRPAAKLRGLGRGFIQISALGISPMTTNAFRSRTSILGNHAI